MTSAVLLAYIGTAIMLQLFAAVGLAVWRRRTVTGVPLVPDAQAVAIGSAGAWSGWRDFRVVRREFEDAAQTRCSFHLKPVDDAPLKPFQPGHYLTFSLKLPTGVASAPGGERTITRCYSLSDQPDPMGYRITIKYAPPPASQPDLPPGLSSNHFHDRVHEGDVLSVRAPSGHFFINPSASVPAVFIAGGIGITRMMSMLRWCVAEQPERLLHFYFGVRSSGDHAFKRVLEDLAAAHPAFS